MLGKLAQTPAADDSSAQNSSAPGCLLHLSREKTFDWEDVAGIKLARSKRERLLASDAGTLPAQTARIARSQVSLAQAGSLAESGTPQKKGAEDQTQSSTRTESSVHPEDAVITLHGVCSSSVGATQEKDESCKTVVSRREFEFLANAINLGGKPISMGARQNLAKTYAQYLVYEQPAKKAGLENTGQYAEIMRWLRLRMLTDLLRERIVEEYRTPSEAEVARYYVKMLLRSNECMWCGF
jgi:hypothetical protein